MYKRKDLKQDITNILIRFPILLKISIKYLEENVRNFRNNSPEVVNRNLRVLIEKAL